MLAYGVVRGAGGGKCEPLGRYATVRPQTLNRSTDGRPETRAVSGKSAESGSERYQFQSSSRWVALDQDVFQLNVPCKAAAMIKRDKNSLPL